MTLDYSIQDPAERVKICEQIINNTPPEQLTPFYLETLSNYIVFAMQKEQKKRKQILTDNRMVTINKRETSYQGLVDKLENGQDGIYSLMTSNGKNTILSPQKSISAEERENIPGLAQLDDSIKRLTAQLETATGRKRYLIKKQIIQMRQQQYIIKNDFRQPMRSSPNFTLPTFDPESTLLQGEITLDKQGNIHDTSTVSFFNPNHISALLINYPAIQSASQHSIHSGCWHLLQDFNKLLETTIKQTNPFYYDIILFKIQGLTNEEIQAALLKKYNHTHSIQYISSLWRHKIPKLLADAASENYITWYYTEKERGKWKRCSRCGEVKLALNRYFSKNSASADGFYSICKACRNKKKSLGKTD